MRTNSATCRAVLNAVDLAVREAVTGAVTGAVFHAVDAAVCCTVYMVGCVFVNLAEDDVLADDPPHPAIFDFLTISRKTP